MKTQRVGNFSSSQIHKLMKTGRGPEGFGAAALTYIEEKQMEMRLGRAITSETNAKPTNWGIFIEGRVFDLLPIEYRLESTTRLSHPSIEHWTGAPDCLTETTVVDIKSPYTLKSFCQSVDSFGDIEKFKAAKPEYYWQLVSNAILTEKNLAELIVYVPYKDELEAIRELASNHDGDQNKIAFLNWATDEELPYLIPGNHYENLNVFQFEIPIEDKDILTNTVLKAIRLLKS